MIFDIIKKSKFRLKKNKYKVLEKNIEKYRIEFEDFYHNANLKLKFFNLIDWKIDLLDEIIFPKEPEEIV